ncbi:MAG TPA: fibrobacter succinogenes major paralogous domain-containing protein, partial [Prolixibacteraceae bacterium]|nr:fibrobacter succinogenes major paralogous domain-containing protein [Prolixibacteraceae bacterium]
MKAITITALLLGFVLGAYAQDLIVHKADGTTASFPLNTIDSITFGVSPDIPVSLIDERDGTEYPIVQIGSQVWMAHNLLYLPVVSPVSEGASDAAHYYVYDYNGTSVSEAKATENYALYGVLYNWQAALSACPEGWHMPNDTEWQQLEMHIGMSSEKAGDTDWRGIDEG